MEDLKGGERGRGEGEGGAWLCVKVMAHKYPLSHCHVHTLPHPHMYVKPHALTTSHHHTPSHPLTHPHTHHTHPHIPSFSPSHTITHTITFSQSPSHHHPHYYTHTHTPLHVLTITLTPLHTYQLRSQRPPHSALGDHFQSPPEHTGTLYHSQQLLTPTAVTLSHPFGLKHAQEGCLCCRPPYQGATPHGSGVCW